MSLIFSPAKNSGEKEQERSPPFSACRKRGGKHVLAGGAGEGREGREKERRRSDEGRGTWREIGLWFTVYAQ